jgi:hypothetical protein
MKPAIVMPLHDPDGSMFPHLEAITPSLKEMFKRAYLGVMEPTRDRLKGELADLKADQFFELSAIPTGEVGEQFHSLYFKVAEVCPAEQILHLCFLDRVAFALETDLRDQFVRDVLEVAAGEVPLLCQRSEAAWDTHPRNYREIEQMVTRVGELLFGKTLDFAWCHLVLRAGDLRDILPHVKEPGLSMLTEILLGLIENIETKDVDWLAWEDPFIESRDPDMLRREREGSRQETRKRLSYVIPKLRVLMNSVEKRPRG